MCVTVYSTARDVLARRLVYWLTLKGVDTKHKLIDRNPQWSLEYQRIGGSKGDPISVIEHYGKNECVRGVDQRLIARALRTMH